MSINPNAIVEAAARLQDYVRETPLDLSSRLSQISSGRVYLKLENLQHTGSFKLRGALNKLLSLTPAQRAVGVVAASSGNHGIAVAHGAALLKTKAIIFTPTVVAPSKVETIRTLGATVEFFGDDCADTEIQARRFAAGQGLTYISPYNDAEVIAGQGTVGVEIARQLNSVDAVLVAVGGGGLISGIGAYLKSIHPRVRMIGCEPENSCEMSRSILAGQIVHDDKSLPTLSDATAGGLEPGAITFDLCRDLIDEFVLVSEGEIIEAMRWSIDKQHLLIEGAAGVALAAFLKRRESFKNQHVVIVICGANIGLETLKSIL